ncbi:MAG: Bax inhibitor-1/YccA family protein [Phycisphaerales bacterium]|nr:Bax inhibitor-1/YccA family protein [Phycisphaerales bacterium]
MTQFQNFDDSLMPMNQDIAVAQQRFITKVFGWMAIGLGITAVVALAIAGSHSAMQYIAANRGIWIGLMIAQFVVVMGLAAGINRISAGLATLLFLFYSALTGATFSVLFMVFTRQSLFSTFITAAAMFGAMALFGYITKRDLTSMGHFAMMALIGIIIAMVVNIFMASSELQFIISGVGVLLFMGLTAYDTQRLKYLYMAGPEGSQANQKAAISGALQLYLDFINLFLFLLQFMGQQRD